VTDNQKKRKELIEKTVKKHLAHKFNSYYINEILCSAPYYATVNGLKKAMPCGRCFYCRLKKKQEWKFRILSEFSTSQEGYFITLTYDNLHVTQELEKKHIKNFLDSLRRHFKRDRKEKLRYYVCGEYGERFGRPHWHLAIFNKITRNELEKYWKRGFIDIQPLNNQTASYIAGYVLKKMVDDGKRDLDRQELEKKLYKSQSRLLGYKYILELISKKKYDKIKSVPKSLLKKIKEENFKLYLEIIKALKTRNQTSYLDKILLNVDQHAPDEYENLKNKTIRALEDYLNSFYQIYKDKRGF
jgi:hypothetical protein